MISSTAICISSWLPTWWSPWLLSVYPPGSLPDDHLDCFLTDDLIDCYLYILLAPYLIISLTVVCISFWLPDIMTTNLIHVYFILINKSDSFGWYIPQQGEGRGVCTLPQLLGKICHFLFLLLFDQETCQTCKNTIKQKLCVLSRASRGYQS